MVRESGLMVEMDVVGFPEAAEASTATTSVIEGQSDG